MHKHQTLVGTIHEFPLGRCLKSHDCCIKCFTPLLYKGRELDFYCFPPLQATVYSLIKLPSRVLIPPNPQFWRNKNFKVPHFTPKLGGHGGRGFRGLNNHKTKTDRTCVYTIAFTRGTKGDSNVMKIT